MVQLMRSENFPAATASGSLSSAIGSKAAPVKLEIAEDPLEEQYGPLNKRSKTSQTLQQWGAGANAFPVPPAQYNPLDEPSPLGLRLRKSPSLLDLIQMKLSQGGVASAPAEARQSEKPSSGAKKDKPLSDKLKASNFPASVLRIGSWEYTARYEGELVAKCYFAKHKLVWEILVGGLKSKIEIQWSDIMGLKANCPEDGPGTLNVVLARQPLFFRETNPQPRKHTLWQAAADFTNGQASLHKQHFLQCPQGLLNKHFDKLIQCDMRLNFLSQQPELVVDSPYFEKMADVFSELDESNDHELNQVENGRGSSFAAAGFQNLASPSAGHSSSLDMDRGDHTGTTSELMSREAPSPSSVMDTHSIEGRGNFESVDSRAPRNWDQIKVPGLTPSMSMSDLMNHIGNCISGQMNSGNTSSLAADGEECQEILEDIAQYLLSDTQNTSSSDEKRLMARVNSLCCLLQKDPDSSSHQNLQTIGEGSSNDSVFQLNQPSGFLFPEFKPSEGNNMKDAVSSSIKAPSGMSRKDSFGDLLLQLPRIASLPKFLFHISEEDGGEKQSR
ncbi:unnamed protein product [Linum trigynum]|uniref:TRF2/HOY1 PH-like domain-containing protein n=1 Tax=Linum trigynum TaxID=586398 RepID=A0AAV2CS67_9ROSI